MRWWYGGIAVPYLRWFAYQDHFEFAMHYTLTLRGKCTMLRNTRQATLDRIWNTNGRYGYQGKNKLYLYDEMVWSRTCGRLGVKGLLSSRGDDVGVLLMMRKRLSTTSTWNEEPNNNGKGQNEKGGKLAGSPETPVFESGDSGAFGRRLRFVRPETPVFRGGDSGFSGRRLRSARTRDEHTEIWLPNLRFR
jgi:hypothetical protein